MFNDHLFLRRASVMSPGSDMLPSSALACFVKRRKPPFLFPALVSHDQLKFSNRVNCFEHGLISRAVSTRKNITLFSQWRSAPLTGKEGISC